ncbi:MAG: hypothetical protein JXA54_04635 [Candidatus Heimdallarchaeota archaeon]|nr:hypothetical protein [Candidatus Heimdallarchaeota archaeon]
MSIRNAHAFKSGILFDQSDKKILIIPFKVEISPTYDRSLKFPETINRTLYYLFYPSVYRYTIIFSRDIANKPEIFLNIYLTAKTQTELSQKAPQVALSLKSNLTNYGISLINIDTQNYLKKLQSKIPFSVTAVNPLIYNIKGSFGINFLSVAKLFFDENHDALNDLPVFLRDFYSVLNKGELNLDIINAPVKKDSKFKSSVSIIISLETSKLEQHTKVSKKLDSLLKLFCNQRPDNSTINYSFVNHQELQEHFGKLIMGQGWKYMPIDYTNFLNYAAFLNILLDTN